MWPHICFRLAAACRSASTAEISPGLAVRRHQQTAPYMQQACMHPHCTCGLDAQVDDRLGGVRYAVAHKGDVRAVRACMEGRQGMRHTIGLHDRVMDEYVRMTLTSCSAGSAGRWPECGPRPLGRTCGLYQRRL